jgi:peptide/nickel transport system permease protein
MATSPTNELKPQRLVKAAPSDSLRMRMWRRFVRHRLAMASLAILILITAMVIAAPLVTRYSPVKITGQIEDAPSREHVLGTDRLGRDVWSRLVYGGRVSLSVGIVAVSISIAISVVLGSLSGFYGGWVDMVIMRITDVMMVFPGLILIMVVVSVVGPSIYNVMAVIGILGWTGTTRLLRGQILSVREWDFVTAARSVGVPDRRIMLRHILPNSLAPLLVAATFGVAGAILTEAGLSYLGLGVLPPAPSWGNMLNGAQSVRILESLWWLWVPPGAAIFVTVLAVNFLGDGLRDALDPRITLD